MEYYYDYSLIVTMIAACTTLIKHRPIIFHSVSNTHCAS